MIDALTTLLSPIFLPLGVSYADLRFYLEEIAPYLLLGAAALLVTVLIQFVAMRLKKGWRAFARLQALIAFLAAVMILVNTVCYGPMYNTLSAYLNAARVELTDDTVAQSLNTIERIGEEGIVLLKNDEDTLPLAAQPVNVFGWASTMPYIGGTGSGASSAAAAIDILTSLRNAGFEPNPTLIKMYTDYCAERPTADMFGQNLTLPEPPPECYTETLMTEAQAFSDTAIIVIARGGGENYDLPTDMHAVIHGTYNVSSSVSVTPDTYPYTKATYTNNGDYDDFDAGESYLELSNTEEALIETVCAAFDRVVVVINACNPMELHWLDHFKPIRAALLVPAPGAQGFAALGKILAGTINPSGRTADTYVRDLLSTPTIHNTGIFAYTNTKELQQSIAAADSTYQGALGFINYAEGIYTGYKFYETAAEEGLIEYDAMVQYPFGYGLSYTTFQKAFYNFNDDGDTIRFTASVTNTGSRAGRDVVQVYYTPPYTNGGIEKASVHLIDFAKTGVIEPGKSELVYFSIAKEDMAAYDAQGIKITGGGYLLEAGEYIVSLRDNAHSVCDEASFTLTEDILFSHTARSSDKTTATNRFEAETRGDFTQLSRKDGFVNYEDACGMLSADAYVMDDATRQAVSAKVMGGYRSAAHDDPNAVMPARGKVVGLTLASMTGLAYDDPRWDTLLNQMTPSEMNRLINAGGWQTSEVRSIGKMATSDCDGPAGLNNFITGACGTTYPSEVLMAQTWSKALAYEIGTSMGSEFAAANNYGWYGPAMNLHRSAFSGRNFEYYSEDGVFSGFMASQTVNGAAQFGVYPYLKHFVLNDQELNRTAILLTFASEQAIRELYLKPFEMAVKRFSGSSLAMMSSYNWIGTTPACASDALLNGVLRDEWGFRGMVITDYAGSYGYMITDNCIRNGGDLMLGYGSYDANDLNMRSASVALAMRQASKNILYTIANSGYYASGEAADAVNRMDELFSTVNRAVWIALGVMELTILLIQYILRKTRKTAANHTNGAA